MLEVKVTVAAPELVAAINTLAAAISGTQVQPQAAPVAAVPSQPPVSTTHPAVVPAIGAPTKAPYIGNTPTPAQTALPPVTQSAPATYLSPTTAASSAQQAIPSEPQAAPAPIAGVPLAQPPQYTIDQIMAAGTTLMDAGKINELVALLGSFGVQAVTDLKPEHYGAFATALREMGAKI